MPPRKYNIHSHKQADPIWTLGVLVSMPQGGTADAGSCSSPLGYVLTFNIDASSAYSEAQLSAVGITFNHSIGRFTGSSNATVFDYAGVVLNSSDGFGGFSISGAFTLSVISAVNLPSWLGSLPAQISFVQGVPSAVNLSTHVSNWDSTKYAIVLNGATQDLPLGTDPDLEGSLNYDGVGAEAISSSSFAITDRQKVWSARIADFGVQNTFDFETTDQLGTDYGRGGQSMGGPFGYLNSSDGLGRHPVLDNTLGADGAQCLRFDVPSQTPADTSGSWFTQFTRSGNGFICGAGQQFYTQYRVRYSPEMLSVIFYQGPNPNPTRGVGTVAGGASTTSLTTSSFTPGAAGNPNPGHIIRFDDTTATVALRGVQAYLTAYNPNFGSPILTIGTPSGGGNVNAAYVLPAVPQIGDTFQVGSPGAGFKLDITGQADGTLCAPTNSTVPPCASSCTDQEITTQNTLLRRLAQMYHACNIFKGFEPTVGGLILFQNAMPAPFCTYQQVHATPPTQFTTGNCFPLVANEWLTFTKGVNLGALGPIAAGSFLTPNLPVGSPAYLNSRVRLWCQRDPAVVGPGVPATLLIDFRVDLWASSMSSPQKYGKIWITPYHSNKDPTMVHPLCKVWYDSMIISKYRPVDCA